MRRLLAILMVAPLLGCGAHLHRPVDDQLARSAGAKLEELGWDEAFERDRGQRDAAAEREAELGQAYADARREAELLDVLTEPVGERSWAKLEDRFVALAACMLDEPSSHGGRACRGRVDETARAAARALLFEACPAEGCAWVSAIVELRVASSTLASELAAYDRARGLAGLTDARATAAACPVPIRIPATLREQGQRLTRACASYDAALEAVALALPEGSGVGRAITDYRALARARDSYRVELRSLVAELSSLRFDGRFDAGALDQQVGRYLALQAEYALALAGLRIGDFADLALEGTAILTREHRAAILRTLARIGTKAVEAGAAKPGAAKPDAPARARTPETLRSGETGSRDPNGSSVPGTDPAPSDPGEPPRTEDPVPPRPIPEHPVPPRPVPEPDEPADAPAPVPTPTNDEDQASVDVELLDTLGTTLVPIFGDAWQALHEQGRRDQRGSLLLAAEIERIQLDAMTRRLGNAEDRLWLELGAIETQLLALLRLRAGLDADWIPATRPSTPELTELDGLALELELAQAVLAQSKQRLAAAVDKHAGKSGPPAKGSGSRDAVADAKLVVREARADVDAAADAYHRHLEQHGAALCVRRGSVSQTYEREPACVAPIERLVGLHAELVGVSLPRLESLERSAARRRDEAALVRDQAALEIRITYIAAAVAALQRFTAGGLESRDIAAIVGSVVGIGLGAAITAGVYIP